MRGASQRAAPCPNIRDAHQRDGQFNGRMGSCTQGLTRKHLRRIINHEHVSVGVKLLEVPGVLGEGLTQLWHGRDQTRGLTINHERYEHVPVGAKLPGIMRTLGRADMARPRASSSVMSTCQSASSCWGSQACSQCCDDCIAVYSPLVGRGFITGPQLPIRTS